jgi:DNA repair protein RecN (Recombination protein N)
VLEEIRIRGLGVISDAVLEFGRGLTVVTGETGAGKTMVLSGLALLFGDRADYSRIRPGVESASVEGRLLLDPGSAAAEIVADAGGDIDADGALVLRRVIGANGRSRAAAGGAAVPSAVLTRLSERLLAVHGQSDQQRLSRPAEQRQTLDRYAGLDLQPCRAAFARWRAVCDALDRRARDARELEREAELLRFGLAEIAAVAPQQGEDSELAMLSARLEHADSLRVAARMAHNALLGDAEDPIADAADVQSLLGLSRRALSQVAGTDADLDALASRLTDLVAATADLGAELAGYELKLDADPSRLAATQERRAELNSLTRKYGPDITAVLAWAEEAEKRLADSDTSEEALAALAHERDEAQADYLRLAQELSRERQSSATELSGRITEELAGLAMSGAAVIVSVTPRAATEATPVVTVGSDRLGATAEGIDEVEILLRAHLDAPALPVQRGASGGELSRVMLAVEVVLAGTDPVPTMVFDEVDAGVGGRAAIEVGRRLSRLADQHQVIVVTHLAQVASFADNHLVVDKTKAADGEGVTRSDIRAVSGAERLSELARMLAGDDTPVARKHAAELLAAAERSARPAKPTAADAATGKPRPAAGSPRRRTRSIGTDR